MRKVKEKVVALLLAVTLVAGATACSKIDESAKQVCADYITSVASGDSEKVQSLSDLSAEDAKTIFGNSYKDEVVSCVLAASTYVIDDEKSIARAKDGTGKFVCVLSIPDYVAVDASNPKDYEEFKTKLLKAKTNEVTLEINLKYSDGTWKVSDAKENLKKILDPIYVPDYEFFLDSDCLFESVELDYVSNTSTSSISDVVTDASELILDVQLSRFGVELFDELDLNFELSNSNGVVMTGEPGVRGKNMLLIKMPASEFVEPTKFVPQDTYTLKLFRGDINIWEDTFDVVLTEYTTPSRSIVDDIFWQHADSSGSYFNTNQIEAKIVFNDAYLNSGRESDVSYSIYNEEGFLVEDSHFEVEANGYVCIYKSSESLATGTYVIEVYNNEILAGSASVLVINNMNPDRYKEETVATDVKDKSDSKISIYSGSSGAVDLISKYSSIKYDKKVLNLNTFRNDLDAVLASGDNAPDMFICDISYASHYAQSDTTVSLNSIGIDYDEFRFMYEYTFAMGMNSEGVIKGVTWEIQPGAVFYNRNVAEKILGVSEPKDVQPYFSTWDAFLSTARYVNETSNGSTKIVCDVADIEEPYILGREDAWALNGNVQISEYMGDFFDLSFILNDEELTWGSARWSTEWSGRMNNKSVLSYFGTLEFGDLFLNNTGSTWGVVRAPEDYYDGGYYIFVTKYCDKDASAAQIIRDLSLSQVNLEAMADDGATVNNLNIMLSCAGDNSYTRKWLGGQNPYTVFTGAAWKLNGRSINVYDDDINTLFADTVRRYTNGDFNNVEQAKSKFLAEAGELIK